MKCVVFITLGIIVFVMTYFPSRHARHFSFVGIEDIVEELYYENVEKQHHTYCNYLHVIGSNKYLNTRHKNGTDRNPRYAIEDGLNVPQECTARVKIAIIVPYRNRNNQLQIFLKYMHNFIQKQNVAYRIIIVNQTDNLPFNRGKLLNYGAMFAIKTNVSCLILHDVDLLPITSGNIYACNQKPRHMSTNVDIFRFNLPYVAISGGVLAIKSSQYNAVNGMSNRYYGWGGEDDDFYKRLKYYNILPIRFPPIFGMYVMLKHVKQIPSQDRFRNLDKAVEKHWSDGLSSLEHNYSVLIDKLCTYINVAG